MYIILSSLMIIIIFFITGLLIAFTLLKDTWQNVTEITSWELTNIILITIEF